ncbi:hypothetical protein DNH61_21135 [Paenibacillus sambharensis]|uniref:ABC-2 type transporter transmembrane domain-containing protein n=1 Tax=Paenibacillus sambharensis TaxID=1803190 RepID=A0A2W1LG17_9BACL|nr:ABC transporter permease [Paenibacillus sambharensis]PZD93992.1 hypothetical protein DNH61_21135 [Paenibacillus sambharensis]
MKTMLKVTQFEFRYQIKSKFFIVGMILLFLFMWSEFSPYLRHYPIQDNNDIQQLFSKGIHQELLRVEVSPAETLSAAVLHMEQLKEGDFSAENVQAAKALASQIKAQNLSLEQAHALVEQQYPSFVDQWNVFIEERGVRLGNIEEVAPLFRYYYERQSFSREFALLWSDRLQIIMSALSIPAFLLLFFKDRRYHAIEWLRAKPVTGFQYITGKYIGTVLAWCLPALIVSTAANIWLGLKFTMDEYAYHFMDVFLGLLIYVLPAFVFSGALIILLGFLFHNEIAALPIFIVYLLFNVAASAFGRDESHPLGYARYMIRLDEHSSTDWLAYIPHQSLVLGATLLMMLWAGQLWLRQGLKGKGR